MPASSSFLHTLRLLWVGVNVAVLIVSASGYRDLSGLMVMLSFPADAVGGILLMGVIEGVAWNEPVWLINLSYGVVATACGYVQWFVIGRALAHRAFARFPSRRLLKVGRVGVVVVFLGLAFMGLAVVRAGDEAEHYRDRAMSAREGMTIDEVWSILGDPKSDEAATTEITRLCPAGTARVTSYWYEHEWLPRRLSPGGFFLSLCLDRQDKVVGTTMGHTH